MHYTHRLSERRIHQIAGWFVLGSLGLVFVAIVFVVRGEHAFEEKFTVDAVFPEAYGVRPGRPVVLLGVNVGKVVRVELDEHDLTHVTLEVLARYRDKIRRDSVARVARSGGFVGDPQIEITLGSKKEPVINRGEMLAGEVPYSVDQMLADLKPLFEDSKRALARVEAVTADLQAAAELSRKTLETIKVASEHLPGTLADGRQTAASVRRASDDLPRVTASLVKSADRVGAAAESLQKATAGIPDVVANAKATSEDLRAVSADLRKDLPPLMRSTGETMRDMGDVAAGARRTFPFSLFARRGAAMREQAAAATPTATPEGR